jgi:hypothetical protein
MIKKLRKIALGTIAIAAVIALFATGPEVAQLWSQVANAQDHEDHENSLIEALKIGQQHHLDDQIQLQTIHLELPPPEIHPPPPEIEPHH